jgi:alcohol dehydrogenase class IV
LLIGEPSGTQEQAAWACARVTARLVRELAIPPLSAFGLREHDVPEMVALARKASSMRFNPVALSDDALARILIAGIRGDEPLYPSPKP